MAVNTTLPELGYSLGKRKRSIAIIWTAIITITCIQFEVLYFTLHYAAHKKQDKALEIPTTILLVLSVLTIIYRSWLLMRKGSQCRIIDGRWYSMDFFNYTAILGFVIVTAVLSVATADEVVDLRQASMPQAIVLYLAGGLLTVTGVISTLGLKLPIRMSSTPRGSVCKPGVFVVMEDIVAVDGGGGEGFRRALRARYEASETFRRMLEELNWFWGLGSVVVATVTTIVVYVVKDLNVVFAIGQSPRPSTWNSC
ncbi:uncharacterized protein Z519_04710 [Cladophialophora bantiana CBS 173.52]|uniref:Uncharacterized protein n=1 Tax=Cladophialophora bantiana (strain ATCC 10958 / CBS 173.52 / CDC B-1940 / NIH 8579) TaxID=1442370 RepID=A0A0D2HMX4_CLAB1|nr:uncharacterized protein Z519_04710 [Cladophialophora bantiana CBS 173.52]KIW94733.1 hypothetical protein Z519_04710 [Cladophialophora bantiana CBS 173.52]